MIIDLTVLETENKPVCKGLFFRVRDSHFGSKKGITRKRDYQLLKRLSCSGCPDCDQLWDELKEQMYSIIEAGEDGNIVQLRRINISRDWETGYVDSWDLALKVVSKS
jgi:hypothetical protein